MRLQGSVKQESFLGFAFAIVMFSLATSLFFTPLPIYLKQIFNGQSSMVYVAYILNSIGATAGYFLIRNRARSMDLRKQMPRFVLIRCLLIFTFVGVIQFALSPTILTGVLLVFLGFSYAMYYIMMISLVNGTYSSGKIRLLRRTRRFRRGSRLFSWAIPMQPFLKYGRNPKFSTYFSNCRWYSFS